MYEELLKGLHLVFEGAVFVVLLIRGEGLLDDPGHKAGFGGHHLGQFAGAFDGLAMVSAEVFDEVLEGGEVLFEGFDAVAGELANGDLGYGQAIVVEVEAEVIGDDEVGEGGAVAVELLFVAGLFGAFQVFIEEVFGLDEAKGDLVAGEDVIGGSAGLALGLVSGADAGN